MGNGVDDFGKTPLEKNASLEKAEQQARISKEMLEKGIEPEFYATDAEIAAAKTRIQYNPENLHLAIAGFAGCGKSSLVNALRRIPDSHPQAAPTGTIETTMVIGRYPDTDQELPFKRFIWYDIPGAGTSTIDDWQYFKNQGLFALDVVILVTDNRFLKSDITLLRNCERYQVPTFIVRSKADAQIDNIIAKERQTDVMDFDSFLSFGPSQPSTITYEAAKSKFINETHQNIKYGLAGAQLPDQRVYIVTRNGVQAVATQVYRMNKDKIPLPVYTGNRLFDERDLLKDILVTTYKRRYATDSSVEELERQFNESQAGRLIGR